MSPLEDLEAGRDAFWADRAMHRASSAQPDRHLSVDSNMPPDTRGLTSQQRARGYSDSRFDYPKYTSGLRPPPAYPESVRYQQPLGPQRSFDHQDQGRRHSRAYSNASQGRRSDDGYERARRQSRSHSNASQGQKVFEDAERNMRLLHPGRARIKDWKEGYQSPKPMQYSESRSKAAPIAGVAAGAAVGAVAVGGAAEAAKGGGGGGSGDCCGFGDCFGCDGCDGSDDIGECFAICEHC